VTLLAAPLPLPPAAHRMAAIMAAVVVLWVTEALPMAVTALLGVLSALMQHDLKRLLAYHTVENIGIIFIGLGLALAFEANAMGLAAALALTAGLFHVSNHSVFKSLLFFGAGAVPLNFTVPEIDPPSLTSAP